MTTLTLGDAAHPLYLYVVFALCVAGVVVLLASAALSRAWTPRRRGEPAPPLRRYEPERAATPVVAPERDLDQESTAPVRNEPAPAAVTKGTAPTKRAAATKRAPAKKTAVGKSAPAAEAAYPDEVPKRRAPSAPRKRAARNADKSSNVG